MNHLRLPKSFSSLFSLFSLVDAIYCFLKSRNLPCTFKRIEFIANQLSQVLDEKLGVDLDQIAVLWAICPKLFHIQSNYSMDPADNELIYRNLYRADRVSKL